LASIPESRPDAQPGSQEASIVPQPDGMIELQEPPPYGKNISDYGINNLGFHRCIALLAVCL
jgi:hypothetical protein